MKKIVIFFIFLFVFSSTCWSAKPSYETVFVEDSVERWIKNNIDDILQLRDSFKTNVKNTLQEREWLESSTVEQIQLLWLGKFLEVLELGWTDDEKQHLSSVLEFIVVNNPFIYVYSSEETEEVLEALEIAENWGDKWVTYAVEKLGWDDSLVHAISETLAEMDEDKKVDPRFKRIHEIRVDGVIVPHVRIDGVYVRLDSLE